MCDGGDGKGVYMVIGKWGEAGADGERLGWWCDEGVGMRERGWGVKEWWGEWQM